MTWSTYSFQVLHAQYQKVFVGVLGSHLDFDLTEPSVNMMLEGCRTVLMRDYVLDCNTVLDIGIGDNSSRDRLQFDCELVTKRGGCFGARPNLKTRGLEVDVTWS